MPFGCVGFAIMKLPARWFIAFVLLLAGLGVYFARRTPVSPTPSMLTIHGKTYYVVKANDVNMNSGDKVCASHGLTCVGYKTYGTNDVCKAFHPTAATMVSVNGSKAGFYCDGAPQQGLACEGIRNTCEVCPACNENRDCSTDLTALNQIREAYVECSGGAASDTPTSSSGVSSGTPTPSVISAASMASLGPKKISCSFSQKPLKKVTCGAVKAADTFCVTVMQSISAYATLCQDNGSVVCAIPCTAPGIQNLKQCAAGGVMTGSCQ